MQLTRQWLEQVVIGLGLCPFAAQPLLENRVRIHVCDSTTELHLLETLHAELDWLDQHPDTELETTLLVLPNMLADFADYNQFLDQVDALLDEFSWHGKYQVASFHPQYCFAGVAPEAAENLTNRAPYPILHLIREDSLAVALAHVERPEEIPAQNIRRVNSLRMDEKYRLFPWIFPLSRS
ncbi:MAG: DUF1415 domain-containing protein [Gammaproteobacteria bacterium]|nr:DUF1415 domain-containing protein [Gammaproteobacteria bacterium]